MSRKVVFEIYSGNSIYKLVVYSIRNRWESNKHMKFILLASASLLCAPSVWVTEYPEYPLGPLPEKVVADSHENGVYAKTSGISQ